MIALAVYAAIVTVLLIIAACCLLVLVRDQKEIVRRATEARLAKVIDVKGGYLTVPSTVTAEDKAKIRAAFSAANDLAESISERAGVTPEVTP